MVNKKRKRDESSESESEENSSNSEESEDSDFSANKKSESGSSSDSKSSDSGSDSESRSRSKKIRQKRPVAATKKSTPVKKSTPIKKESANVNISKSTSGKVLKTKSSLVNQLLRRWWYALPKWPPEDFDPRYILKKYNIYMIIILFYFIIHFLVRN